MIKTEKVTKVWVSPLAYNVEGELKQDNEPTVKAILKLIREFCECFDIVPDSDGITFIPADWIVEFCEESSSYPEEESLLKGFLDNLDDPKEKVYFVA